MARKRSTTVQLDKKRAEKPSGSRDGQRTALRDQKRRPPSTGLFVSTDPKLGEESETFRDLER